MKLIGLNGRLRSGKDTSYEVIKNDWPSLNIQRAGFADKLKLAYMRCLGFNISDPNEAVKQANHIKETGRFSLDWQEPTLGAESTACRRRFTGRETQQWFGTEGHRDVFGDDFWIDVLLPQNGLLADRFPGVQALFITDCRYPNEAQRILDHGGEVWLIDANKRLGPLPPDAHPSERQLPWELITRCVTNDTTLDEFKNRLVRIGDELFA